MHVTFLGLGSYCDVISGNLVDGACTGETIEVGYDGSVSIYMDNDYGDDSKDGIIAIHTGR